MIAVTEDARLDALVREEWWDVCRRVRPDIQRTEFDQTWAEFQTWKAQKALN